MKRTYVVTIDVDPGDGTYEEMDRIFEQYISHPEFPFMSDYHPDSTELLGWPGPFVNSVTVERTYPR